jgi:nitrite reductase/ring-hydroxylating ferredoxin subunit
MPVTDSPSPPQKGPESDPVYLCSLDDIRPTGAFGITLEQNGKELNLLVVIDQTGSSPDRPLIRAYENVCPHIQTPLEMMPNAFLDKDDPDLLVCATHGTRFQVNNGLCIAGPCYGESLKAIAVIRRGRDIYLQNAQNMVTH